MSADRSFLETQILAEHSKAQTMRLVRWIGDDPQRVALLMEIFLGTQYRLTQRSAWVLRYVGEAHPSLMAPWLGSMIDAMRQPDAHDAVKRNVLNVFEVLEIPAEHFDNLADISFQLLENPQEAIAIRCAAMTVLTKICRFVPELLPELELLLESRIDQGSPGMQSRTRKTLESIRKTKK